jgi:phosphate uptake regulator
MHKTFTKILTRKIRKNEDNLETITQLLFVSRHLERVGDHAKNIGESSQNLYGNGRAERC